MKGEIMEDIKHLEYLSKLEFSEEERENFASEFDGILEFVNQISEIELGSGLDKDDAILVSDLRADEPVSSMPREEALQNVPKQKDGCYVTPLVVE